MFGASVISSVIAQRKSEEARKRGDTLKTLGRAKWQDSKEFATLGENPKRLNRHL
jgi:hypothetical protein